MAKKLDLNKSVFVLTQEYPELVDIMAELGFTEITKKAMRHSIGKMVTIPKGAKMKNIPMTKIVTALMEHGFELVGEGSEIPFAVSAETEETEETAAGHSSENRTEQLKAYLKRLGEGEDLEEVRADFVRAFREVDASEIMQAEQELLAEGTPLSEVQRLCDVHSALFHGATIEERIANAEKEVEASLERKKARDKSAPVQNGTDEQGLAAVMGEKIGHPLYTLTKENNALSQLLAKFKKKRDASLLPSIRELSIHYAKKGRSALSSA